MRIQELLQNPNYKQKRVLENLICHFLEMSREKLRLSLDQQIEEKILSQINQAYNDFVIQKKPLEYVLWYVEFMHNKFKIDHRALIPRPETEYMIQAVNDFVISECRVQSSEKNILFDIGTGCGVLGLSVMLHNPDFFDEAYLSEYIDYTLSLAQENYEILKPRLGKTKVNLVKANLLDFLNNYQLSTINYQLILVANLPYIPEETFNQNVWENVKNREPKPAFVWWDDWLNYYREMFQQIFDFGIKPTMFLEMMTWQVDVLRKEFGEKIEFEEVKTFHFNIRIVKAWLK